jgi:hypothetical protein
MVCSAAAADRVRQLAGPTVQVLIDDRALDPRAIQMLAALLVQQNGNQPDHRPPSRTGAAGPSVRSGRPVRDALRRAPVKKDGA